MSQNTSNRLRYFRELRGLSQEELGAKCHPPISGQHIGKMEKGTRGISKINVENLAKALGNCTASEILMLESSRHGNQNKEDVNKSVDGPAVLATSSERLGLSENKNMPVYGATRDGTAVDLSKPSKMDYPPAELADLEGVTEWVIPDDVNGREARRGDRAVITPFHPSLPDDLVGVSYIDDGGNPIGIVRVLVKETESEIVLSQSTPQKRIRLDRSKYKDILIRKVYDIRKR